MEQEGKKGEPVWEHLQQEQLLLWDPDFQCYTLEHIQSLLLVQKTLRGKWELTTDDIPPSPHQSEGAERGLEEDFIPVVPSFHFSLPTTEESLAGHFSNHNTAKPFRLDHGAFPFQALPNEIRLTNEHKCK